MTYDKYTLKDPIFIYGLSRGSQTELSFPTRKDIMVVGGAATQLYAQELQDERLYRPTTDIDFIAHGSTSRHERKLWAEDLASILRREGHSVNPGLTRFGAEARFMGLQGRDFILHLDCFGPGFFERHKNRYDAEFERSEKKAVDGAMVRYQCPQDVIANKLRRIHSIEKVGNLEPSDVQASILKLIENGWFDDLVIENLSDELENLKRERDANVEDLGRLGYESIIGKVNQYKIEKDIYDMKIVIEAVRRRGSRINPIEFRKTLERALIP